MKKSELRKYAKLIVKNGANIQKGQEVIIKASVGDAYFVTYLIQEAYRAKAKIVTVDWTYLDAVLLNYQYQDVKTLSEIPAWKEERMIHNSKILPAYIHITSEDPDGMKDIDYQKYSEVEKNLGPILKKYHDLMDNKYQWTIAALPSAAWAKKVFPKLTEKQAVAKLWEAIYKCAKVEKSWDEHNAYLLDKCKKLNDLKIKKLTYTSQNGTNFSIELLPNTHFEGGIAKTLAGVYYNPNIPTEECFTSPSKFSANGVVMATKPLSVSGNLVTNFGFRFEAGKIVEVISENDKEKQILEQLISIDEGAAYLGEVALVPFDSPINKTNLLFYNTLFDENACCHLAIGKAYTDTINNYKNLTKEEVEKVGLNESQIHIDFMIGSSDLEIEALTYENQKVKIFIKGNWAI